MDKISDQRTVVRASQSAGQHVAVAYFSRVKPWAIGVAFVVSIILIAATFGQLRSCAKNPHSKQDPGQTIDYSEDISYETCQFDSTIGDPEERHDCCTNTPRLCIDDGVRLDAGSGEASR